MAEQLDIKEIFSLVNSASGNFAFAQETFEQIASLFEAIAASLPGHSTGHQLAKLGADVCEDRASSFLSTRDEYNGHVERYLPYFYGDAAVAFHAEESRQVSTTEYSSQEFARAHILKMTAFVPL